MKRQDLYGYIEIRLREFGLDSVDSEMAAFDIAMVVAKIREEEAKAKEVMNVETETEEQSEEGMNAKQVRDAFEEIGKRIYDLLILVDRAYWETGSGSIDKQKPKKCKGFVKRFCTGCKHSDYCERRKWCEEALIAAEGGSGWKL